MQVISQRTFQFHRADVVPHPVSGELYHLIHESFTVLPNPKPQDVPDWIQDDPLFDLAVQDETLVPVAVLPKPAKKQQPATLPTSGLPTTTGWGAKAK